MSVLNIASRALLANQSVLQTTGNNIANVNTPGYSRQSAVLETIEGQFTGSGYIGKGVNVLTIERNYSAFLTRQAALAGSTNSADTTRATYLKSMEGIFPGGASGLGASISDMLNSFSDVSSAPTDLTARTVALTRVSETASRMRSASQSLDELQLGVKESIAQKIMSINSLASSIAGVNERIAKALVSGQSPNDLLDHRDQLIRDLNQYVQTSSIAATDGTLGIFLAGSQALVLGNSASSLKVSADDFNDPLKAKIAIVSSGQTIILDENTLGGGEVSGLLRFQNNDMAEGRNLLGRLTLAVSTSMNDQHKLGLDLSGNAGGNLFTPTTFGQNNVLQPASPAVINSVGADLSLSIYDVTQFAASDYEVSFSSGSTGIITRRSDGVLTNFDFGVPSPNPSAVPTANTIVIDGISITLTSAQAGDRFLLKPFSTSASNISAEFSTPRSLAIASPVGGKMGAANSGSLQLTSLQARSNPPTVETTATPVVLTFTDANHFTRSDDLGGTSYVYTSGQTIEGTAPATAPLSEWSLVLQGSPKTGDTFTVFGIKDAANNNGISLALNADNATSMMNLRDTAMFDGSVLTDGFAGMISQIGIRTQSASYAADVSNSIAANLEKDRTGVSGVNLDEEAAKLLQFQQAYQAAAKLIQIAQGMFDTLLQTFR